MKSMLHEASSVTKAVEKAWAESGKPTEFTIRVLEVGEKNFLGMTKRPAIVSITYDPKKQGGAVARKDFRSGRPAGSVEVRQPRPAVRQPMPAMEKKDVPVQDRQRQAGQQAPRPQGQGQFVAYDENWTPELAADVQACFKDIADLFVISTPYEVKVDKKMLYIIFSSAILSTPDEDRQLFVSLSYLLIQILKKKHKKKFRGFHLIINTKDHASYNKPKQQPPVS